MRGAIQSGLAHAHARSSCARIVCSSVMDVSSCAHADLVLAIMFLRSATARITSIVCQFGSDAVRNFGSITNDTNSDLLGQADAVRVDINLNDLRVCGQ